MYWIAPEAERDLLQALDSLSDRNQAAAEELRTEVFKVLAQLDRREF